MVFKDVFRQGVNVYAKGSYAPWRHKSGQETLMALGVSFPKLGMEFFQRSIRDNYSSFSLSEKIIGGQFSWKFGAPAGQKLSEMEDYGYAAKRRYQFYRDSGVEDNTGLSRVQQAERLGTLRKRVEWSGSNLTWKSEPSQGYQQELVYRLRKGDCDAQSCLNNTMDTLNGYRSQTMGWWDFSKSWIGHAVGLTQDPTNGQWFLDEYGQVFRVDVDPKADLQTVMREALKQTHRFTVVPISSVKDTWIVPIECSQPGTSNWDSWFNLGEFPRSQGRPKIEYGYELFLGRNFLFDYDE